MNRKRLIGVIGGSTAERKYLDFAYEVGKLLGQRDAIMICGGRSGIMEAACRGIAEAGGIAVGVLPSEDFSTANPFVTIPIATGIGTARNKIIINTAEAFIAVDGKYGTLSEIAFALDAGKKVAGFETWDIEGVKKISSPAEALNYIMEDDHG